MTGTFLRRAIAALAASGAIIGTLSAAPASAAVTWEQGWGTNGRVDDFLAVGDMVYVAGNFTALVDPAGATYPATHLARYNLTTGAMDTSWTPALDLSAVSLTTDGTSLYVGGNFTTVNGATRTRIASFDLGSGVLTNFRPSANKTVNAMEVTGGRLYLGGSFTRVGGSPRNYLGSVDLATSAVNSWAPTADAQVKGMVLSPDTSRLYLAGDFTTLNGGSHQYVGALNTTAGTLLSGFTAGNTTSYGRQPTWDVVYDPVNNRVCDAGDGYQGGVACLDANTGRTVWSATADGGVQAIEYWKGQIWVGGHFTVDLGINGTGRGKIANLDAATGRLLDFNATINSSLGVWALKAVDSRMFVGGDFTKINNKTANRMAAVNDGTVLTAPTAPTALVATGGDAQVALSWGLPVSDGGSALGRYNVYRSTAGGPFALLGTAGQGRAYTDTTAVNDTAYSYQVTATNALGESPASNVVSATPRAFVHVAPSAPRNFAGVGNSTNSVLTWAAPADLGTDPFQGYRVFKDGVLLTTTTALSYTDSAVSRGDTHSYSVVAYSAAGEASTPTITVTNTSTAPTAPLSLAGTASMSTANLTWSAPASSGTDPITSYSVYRDGVQVGTSTTRTFSDTGIVAGGTYTWTVTAMSAAGESAASAPLTLTSATSTVPGAPVATKGSSWFNAVMNWSAPSTGGSPILRYEVFKNGSLVATVSASTRTYSTSTSWFGPTTLSVRAVNAIGTGPMSNVLTW